MERLHTDNNGIETFHTSTDNAGHDYEIHYGESGACWVMNEISFQNGPVKLSGVNGITSEALLAILIHRTEVLNSNFPCKENEEALLGLKAALNAFESRTRDRIKRGVEGRNKE